VVELSIFGLFKLIISNKMIQEIFETLITDIFLEFIQKIGSYVRWVFLKNKYSYKQIQKQDWNGRVGLFLILSIIAIILVASGY